MKSNQERAPGNLSRIWFQALQLIGSLLLSVSCTQYEVYEFSRPIPRGTLPLAATADPGAPPGRLTAMFLGHSTILLSDGETRLMTDGFFSRPPARRYLFGKIAPDPDRIDEALERASVSQLDAIVVGHSHHGHVLDAPRVARKTGAKVIGSQSTAFVCEGDGLDPGQIVIAPDSGGSYRAGRFSIRLIESEHGEFPDHLRFLEKKIMGEITAPVTTPAPVSAFKSGPVYSVLFEHPYGNVLVHPSAGVRPGMLEGRKVDIAFVGVSLLGEMPPERKRDFFKELVEKPGTRRIIPIHWDDYTKPLSDRPVSTRKTDVPTAMAFLESQARENSELEIIHAPPFESLTLFSTPGQED